MRLNGSGGLCSEPTITVCYSERPKYPVKRRDKPDIMMCGNVNWKGNTEGLVYSVQKENSASRPSCFSPKKRRNLLFKQIMLISVFA